MPGTVVRDLLPFLADLGDTFVIDHMGYMPESDLLANWAPTAEACRSILVDGPTRLFFS